jgi:hypothetical protein
MLMPPKQPLSRSEAARLGRQRHAGRMNARKQRKLGYPNLHKAREVLLRNLALRRLALIESMMVAIWARQDCKAWRQLHYAEIPELSDSELKLAYQLAGELMKTRPSSFWRSDPRSKGYMQRPFAYGNPEHFFKPVTGESEFKRQMREATNGTFGPRYWQKPD